MTGTDLGGQFVGHDFVSGRASLSVREGFDVEKDRVATTVRRDEPEALIILPGCDPTLVSHDTRRGECSSSLSGYPRQRLSLCAQASYAQVKTAMASLILSTFH